MPTRLSTAGVAPGDRPDYWRQCVRDAFKADCQVAALGGGPLEIEASLYHFGSTLLIDGKGSAMKLKRQADPAANYVNLLFNLEGSGIIRQDQRETELSPGTHVLFPLRDTSEFEFHDDFRHFSLILPEEQLSALVPNWRNCLFTRMSSDTSAASLFSGFVECLMAHGVALEGPDAKRIADSVASLLAAMLDANPLAIQEKSTRFEAYHRQRVQRFICENLRNPALNVEVIAQGVGLSARYIHRMFSSSPHTLMEWVWIQRLERAARDLADPSAPPRAIGDIAYSWGFNDQAHFSRSFRKHFHATPRAWRQGKRQTEARGQ